MGTAKTNIGHIESAAGVAGLIKVVLSLQHQLPPQNLHFHTPNPHIPWESRPCGSSRSRPRGSRTAAHAVPG